MDEEKLTSLSIDDLRAALRTAWKELERFKANNKGSLAEAKEFVHEFSKVCEQNSIMREACNDALDALPYGRTRQMVSEALQKCEEIK